MFDFVKVYQLNIPLIIKNETMERKILLNDLKTILSEHVDGEGAKALESLSEQTDLRNDLGIDSLDVVNIVIDIESHFNIEIENDSIKKMSTIKNCMDLIAEKVCQPAEQVS